VWKETKKKKKKLDYALLYIKGSRSSPFAASADVFYCVGRERAREKIDPVDIPTWPISWYSPPPPPNLQSVGLFYFLYFKFENDLYMIMFSPPVSLGCRCLFRAYLKKVDQVVG
jgi:hypothetical protein